MRKRLLLDAGVLLRYAVVDDALHIRVRERVADSIAQGFEICFVPQAVREAWNVLTRPSNVGGYGYTASEAEVTVALVAEAFSLLHDNATVFEHWQKLATTYGLIGQSVHDANIVAAALAHGATHILTLNGRDFRRYREIEIIVP